MKTVRSSRAEEQQLIPRLHTNKNNDKLLYLAHALLELCMKAVYCALALMLLQFDFRLEPTLKSFTHSYNTHVEGGRELVRVCIC